MVFEPRDRRQDLLEPLAIVGEECSQRLGIARPSLVEQIVGFAHVACHDRSHERISGNGRSRSTDKMVNQASYREQTSVERVVSWLKERRR
jgi:hypothetical protein